MLRQQEPSFPRAAAAVRFVRHLDGRKIFAKSLFLHRSFQVYVGLQPGCGHRWATLHRHRSDARPVPETRARALVEGSAEDRNLVEEEGSALRVLKQTFAWKLGIGKGAANVTEQLAFQQCLRGEPNNSRQQTVHLCEPSARIARATSSFPVPLSPTISADIGLRRARKHLCDLAHGFAFSNHSDHRFCGSHCAAKSSGLLHEARGAALHAEAEVQVHRPPAAW